MEVDIIDTGIFVADKPLASRRPKPKLNYHYKGTFKVKRQNSGFSRKRRRKRNWVVDGGRSGRNAIKSINNQNIQNVEEVVETIEMDIDDVENNGSVRAVEVELDKREVGVVVEEEERENESFSSFEQDDMRNKFPSPTRSDTLSLPPLSPEPEPLFNDPGTKCAFCNKIEIHNEFSKICSQCVEITTSDGLKLKKCLRLSKEDKNIGEFVFEHGVSAHRHLLLPHPKRRKVLYSSKERTIRRWGDRVESLFNEMTTGLGNSGKGLYIAKIITSLCRKRKAWREALNYCDKIGRTKIPLDTAVTLLTRTTSSKDSAETIMSGINKSLGIRVFPTREQYRMAWTNGGLGAVYKHTSIECKMGDELQTVPVAYIENINEVLNRYVATHKNMFKFPEELLLLRISIDKGAQWTKLSLSFANCLLNQSRYSQIIVGAYNGPDTYELINQALGDVLQRIENVDYITLPDGNTIPVQKFLIGDHKALSACTGHMGQASKHPCVFCVATNDQIRKGPDHSLDYPTRNQQDRNQEFSVKNRSLFKTTPELVPPMLHNILGPVSKLICQLYADCAYLDQHRLTTSKIVVKDIPSQSGKKIVQPTSTKHTIESIQKAENLSKKIIASLQKAGFTEQSTDLLQIYSIDDLEERNECQLAYCLVRIGIKLPKILKEKAIECVFCGLTLHLCCDGHLTTISQKKHNGKVGYLCMRCKIVNANELRNDSSVPVKIFNIAIENLKNEEVMVQQIEKSRMADGFVSNLDQNFENLGIKILGYHGGTVTGNDAQCFLKNIGSITMKMQNYEDPKSLNAQNIIRDLGARYARISAEIATVQSLCRTGYLSTEELRILKASCEKIPCLIQRDFPSLRITPKIHCLAAHTWRFAMKWGSLGNFSEQHIEALHPLWNQVASQFSNFKGGSSNLAAIMKHVNTKSTILFKKIQQE